MTEMNGAALAAMPVAARAAGYDAELVARARVLVETTTLSQVEIGARLGVPATTVSLWKRREGWVRPVAAPRRPSFVRAEGTRGDAPTARQARRAKKMVDRLYRVFNRGVAALEARLGAGEDTLEKDARALASLARTLETLIGLDREEGTHKHPDPEAIDPDEIRSRLARRLYLLGQGGE